MKNIFDLFNEINANGGMIETTTENICYMQDCIGHSSVEEVRKAANSDSKELFYRVYGIAYGTVESIKYYRRNDEKILDLVADYEYIKNELEAGRATIADLKTQRNNSDAESVKLINEKAELQRENDRQKQEIIELKAMLFDLMKGAKNE